ncbi:MAG: glycosyltransferase family 4 protein [Ruminococcaceae bacterium]|nr:glycosyltransferase family 4 protein [Oscillospiraceae bacterium]
MKVLIYAGALKKVEKSGVGQAIYHQKDALKSVGIPVTFDKNEDYDIVHINTIFPDSFFMSLKARAKGKKVVYYAHSTKEDFKNSFVGSNLLAPVFKWWIKRCYLRGDVLITPTSYSKGLLESYGIKKKIYPLSNGINLKDYSNSQLGGCRFREKYGFSPEDKIIISVGHYMNRKGITDFVELAKRLPEYQFIWFGYTPPAACTPDVREAVKTELPNLHFPGLATQEELKDAYSGSDMFLFLTHEETEGIVLLEAMAMKLTVLVRDIPIYKDMLTSGYNVYKAGTLDEFERRIKGILTGTYPSTFEEGYNFVKERDIPVVGEKLKEIYKELGL